jgi:hypothetical protein
MSTFAASGRNIQSLGRKSRFDQSLATTFADQKIIPFFDLHRFFEKATIRQYELVVAANKVSIDLDWSELSHSGNEKLVMHVLANDDELLPRALAECLTDTNWGTQESRRARFVALLDYVAERKFRRLMLAQFEQALRDICKCCVAVNDYDLCLDTLVAYCKALHGIEHARVIVPLERFDDDDDDFLSPIDVLWKLFKQKRHATADWAYRFLGYAAGRLSVNNVRRGTGARLSDKIIELAGGFREEKE